MSVIPPKADIRLRDRNGRSVPKADSRLFGSTFILVAQEQPVASLVAARRGLPFRGLLKACWGGTLRCTIGVFFAHRCHRYVSAARHPTAAHR